MGISTGGNSPALARYLKETLKEAIPGGLGGLARQLGSLIRQGDYTREQADELIERKLAEHEK